MAVVDATDGVQIFNFSDKSPLLGQNQTSVPAPLSPSGVFTHELQKGAHTGALAWRPVVGTCLAIGCSHGVCLWHLPKLPVNISSGPPQGASVAWLQSPGEAAVHALAWHPRGHLLAASSSERPGLFLWDVATGSVTSVRAGLESVTLLRWSPCGNYLLAGGRAGSFRIWETSSTWKSAKWTIGTSGKTAPGELVGAEWSPDGRTLLLAHPRQLSALHLTAEAPALTAQVLPVTLPELASSGSINGRDVLTIESVAWDPRGQRLALGLVSKKGHGSLVAIYDARCDPILTARFIGFARM